MGTATMATHKTSVNMKDVAALAKVSLGTVSNVVNTPELVSETTRARVQVAIDKLGWVPNESARQLRAGRSRSIGMVVMDIANPFFTDLVIGVEDHVERRGYSVQISNSAQETRREQRHLSLLEQQRVGGVLLAPIGGVDDRVEQLRRRDIPVVLLDRAGDELNFCSVSVDDVAGGRLAVAHLLARGHRRIALVGGPPELQQVRERRLGAETARARHSGAADLQVYSTVALDAQAGVFATEELLALPLSERPTAVFAANDLLALGVLQACVSHGVRVPDDLAIIGYDDVDYAANAAVPLSSIRQPRRALGERAAELLLEEIETTRRGEPHQHQVVRFDPELVVRRSTLGVAGR